MPERALEAGLTAHLGYPRHDPAGHNSGNSRNGAIGKKVQTGIGPVPAGVPRDRAGMSGPVLVRKRSGRVAGGLDDMIISLYAHGMSVRGILHHLRQVYGTELSPETVSRITDAVLEEVRAWRAPVARRDAAAVAAGLRAIYTAADADAASGALAAFSASPPGRKYPQAVKGVGERLGPLHPVPGLHPAGAKAALHHQQHRR